MAFSINSHLDFLQKHYSALRQRHRRRHCCARDPSWDIPLRPRGTGVVWDTVSLPGQKQSSLLKMDVWGESVCRGRYVKWKCMARSSLSIHLCPPCQPLSQHFSNILQRARGGNTVYHLSITPEKMGGCLGLAFRGEKCPLLLRSICHWRSWWNTGNRSTFSLTAINPKTVPLSEGTFTAG